MYGKVFDSIYTGTLYGQWQAIVTFQQMIVLCDADGILDMTPPGIAAITSIPLEIILKGIEVLSSPDPYSRTPGAEGRRIELIDAHRPWGWQIVNHEKYKRLQDSDTVRAQTRERVRKHREEKRLVTAGNEQKRYTDTNTDTDTDTDTTPKPIVGQQPDVDPLKNKNKAIKEESKQVLQFLNLKTGKAYREVDANLKPIESILKSGVSLQDMKTVTMRKIHDWQADPKMVSYLRPSTLYRRSNFENYLGQTIIPEGSHE